jgi:isocitrate dehydrogenase (NAD+)
VHGTAPDLAGKNVANPSALTFAACMMLDHLGDGTRADRIRAAVESTLRDGTTITRDLGGTASTDEFTDAVIAKLL